MSDILPGGSSTSEESDHIVCNIKQHIINHLLLSISIDCSRKSDHLSEVSNQVLFICHLYS